MRIFGRVVIGGAAVVALAAAQFVAGQPGAVESPAPPAPAAPYGVGHPPFAQAASTSCASAGCHGSGSIGKVGGEHSTWAPEVFPDGPSDPHARAYRVLFNDDSRRMASLLKLPAPPHRTALCLKCHAVDGVEPAGAAAEGVGCGACHGPAEKWAAAHYLPEWKGLTNREKFEQYGFVPTKNVTARALACTACHVGAADREVNHDLIAAGHPRLAFEYTRFHYNPQYRKHWTEATPQPDFEVRAWLIGQAATLRAAVQLLEIRADRAAANDPHTPWPEFSGYSCYSCHQTIGTGDVRRAVGKADRKPGSLAWELWANAAADVAAGNTPAVFPDVPGAKLPEVAALRKLMAKTSPAPAAVRDQARLALAELDKWLAGLQAAEDRAGEQRVPADAPRKLAHALSANALTPDGKALRDHDWDFLSANYLGTAAMYHAAGGSAAEPGWRAAVAGLGGLLRFPLAEQDGRRSDSPAGFGRADREKVQGLFDQLGTATAPPGAK